MKKYKELNTAQLLVGWFHSYLQDNIEEYNKFNQILNERGV